MHRIYLHCIYLTAALVGCSDTVVVGDLQEVVHLKAIPNPDLDILVVVDNSESMAPQQVALADNFPRMMDVLGQLDGGLPNLHLGVITSDMGTSGSSAQVPGPAIGQLGSGGCALSGDDGELQHNSPALTGTFISDVSDGAGGRTRNYTGELRDVFSQIALVGEHGCGFEQHLHAMRRGLENPLNAGFLRPEANLAVIIIADEDDCSALDPTLFQPTDDGTIGPLLSFRCTRHGVRCDPDMTTVGVKNDCVPRADSTLIEDVQPFVDGLVAVKQDARMVMVAGIVGDPGPVEVEPRTINDVTSPALHHSCQFTGPGGDVRSADPAVRLAAFLDAFPGRSQRTSICSADLSSPLAQIGDSAKQLMGGSCLDSSRLADASEAPGVQPACEVVDVRDSAPDAPRALPACDSATASDCYLIVADSTACPASDDHLRLSFRRTAVTADTWTSVRCQVR